MADDASRIRSPAEVAFTEPVEDPVSVPGTSIAPDVEVSATPPEVPVPEPPVAVALPGDFDRSFR